MRADDLASSPTLRFSARPRIATGMLWQETNSFNPLLTGQADFIVQAGEEVVATFGNAANTLGGILRKLDALGARPIPLLAAKARPGGPIKRAVIEDLTTRLVEGAFHAKPDGVCLELHGSMVAEDIDDVEGMVLARLREALGPDVPISVGLDLHGHMTAAMAGHADYLTAYRTHPHADMVETGGRAAALLASIMNSDVRPAWALRTLPFLALFNDETEDSPLRGTRAFAARLDGVRDPAFLDLSIFNVHPFLDLPGMGQAVLAYADSSKGLASGVADAVSRHLWDLRSTFDADLPGLQAIFAQVGEARSGGRGPVAIGDQGDSVLAGSPGDSVEIVRYALRHAPTLKGFAAVYDPKAVQKAHAAGAGTRIEIAIGASVSAGLHPLTGQVLIERMTNGLFRNEGAYMGGLPNDLGECAVLRSGSCVLLATSKAPAACDPGLVRHAGYEIADFDYLVMKAGNHFKLSFEAMCLCLTAPTSGLTSRNKSLLSHKLSRPIYPLDDVEKISL